MDLKLTFIGNEFEQMKNDIQHSFEQLLPNVELNFTFFPAANIDFFKFIHKALPFIFIFNSQSKSDVSKSTIDTIRDLYSPSVPLFIALVPHLELEVVQTLRDKGISYIYTQQNFKDNAVIITKNIARAMNSKVKFSKSFKVVTYQQEMWFNCRGIMSSISLTKCHFDCNFIKDHSALIANNIRLHSEMLQSFNILNEGTLNFYAGPVSDMSFNSSIEHPIRFISNEDILNSQDMMNLTFEKAKKRIFSLIEERRNRLKTWLKLEGPYLLKQQNQKLLIISRAFICDSDMKKQFPEVEIKVIKNFNFNQRYIEHFRPTIILFEAAPYNKSSTNNLNAQELQSLAKILKKEDIQCKLYIFQYGLLNKNDDQGLIDKLKLRIENVPISPYIAKEIIKSNRTEVKNPSQGRFDFSPLNHELSSIRIGIEIKGKLEVITEEECIITTPVKLPSNELLLIQDPVPMGLTIIKDTYLDELNKDKINKRYRCLINSITEDSKTSLRRFIIHYTDQDKTTRPIIQKAG